MLITTQCSLPGGLLALLFVGISGAALAAEEAGRAAVPASQYAPAADLLSQLDEYLARLGRDLVSEAEYQADQRERVAREASTVVVLVQVLAVHDEQNRLQKAALPIIRAAANLADAAEDYAAAKQAYDQLRAAIDSPEPSELPNWKPVADLQLLMLQVPIVNNSLRRGVNSTRFERTLASTAREAATLAALAEASQYDTGYCSDEDDEAEWRAICVAMRDAAGETRQAVLCKDQAAARAGLAKLVETCDQCHERFRD